MAYTVLKMYTRLWISLLAFSNKLWNHLSQKTNTKRNLLNPTSQVTKNN